MNFVPRFLAACLRTTVRLFVRIYYPRIAITGGEHLPRDGPVLIVANHANSLIDPVMVEIAVARPVRFLAKAPLFQVPLLGAILHALGMLPAFRGSDDPSQIRRNLRSLTAGAEYLVKGDALGIFPEGKSHDSLKVEMIRSGAARIALQAVKNGAQQLLIIPIGINYERKQTFRSSVWIRVGKPICAGRLVAEREHEERQALRSLTNEIEFSLKQVVIHLSNQQWEPFLYHLEAIFPAKPEYGRDAAAPLRQRQRIAEAMNHFYLNDRGRAEELAALMEQHDRALAQVGLDMSSPLLRKEGATAWAETIGGAFRLVLGIVPVVAGTLHHAVPFVVVRGLAANLQSPGKTTISLTRLRLGIPIYGLWYFVMWIWIADHWPVWVAWTWTLLMPFAGIFALGCWSRLSEGVQFWWRQLRLLSSRIDLHKFRADQRLISERLEAMAKDYREIRPHPAASSSIAPAGFVKWRKSEL